MREKRFTVRALIVTAALTLVLTLGGVALAAWLHLGSGGLAVLESMELIHHYFPGDHSRAQTAEDAIQGMVDGLGDRWSYYLTADEYAAREEWMENTYVGVGVTYTASEDGTAMEILEVTPGSPAEAAGLLAGERIVAIDGQALNGENMDRLVRGIQEQVGRDVTLTVLSADGVSRQVTVRTGRVLEPPAQGVLLEDDIGYVRIDNFNSGAAAAVRETVEELIGQGARALLFDVRYNPGGYVTEVTGALDYLLPEGPIFMEWRKGGPVRTIYSDAACVDLPMAVLVNADSYSAAELFAAQLRESGGAVLIGQPTCGKGYYQQTFRLPGGGALNLSSGFYTTGSGASLIGTGVTLDVAEEEPEAQVERAVQCLREKLG